MEIEREQYVFLDQLTGKGRNEESKALTRQNAVTQLEKHYNRDVFDFIQCEAGENHVLLLNSLG